MHSRRPNQYLVGPGFLGHSSPSLRGHFVASPRVELLLRRALGRDWLSPDIDTTLALVLVCVTWLPASSADIPSRDWAYQTPSASRWRQI